MIGIDLGTTNSSSDSGDMPEGSGHFDYFQFDESRTERLEQLEKRLYKLYHIEKHQNPSMWSDAVKNCLTTEDFKDVHVIAAVLSILPQIPGLGGQVWDIFEKELFCYHNESAEWIWLKTQFTNMRKKDTWFVKTHENAHTAQKGVIVGQVDPKTGQVISEKPVLKKTFLESVSWSDVLFVLIILMISCCLYFFIFFLLDVM